MYVKCSLSEGKRLMIEILKYIEEICEKNNLQYFVVAGTLLGAVRHKVFIPWDDDIDIIMTKKDHLKLIEAIKNDNNNRFGILDKSIDPNYPLELSKVIMKDTLCELNDELKSVQAKSEVFVDVFTLEFFNEETSRKHRKYVRLFENARKKVVINNLKPSLFRTGLQVFRVASKIVVPINVIDRFKKRYSVENGAYAGFDVSQSSDFICRVEDIYPLKQIPFEDVKVWAPNNPDAILKYQYGPNYMELPPEDKRHTHSQSISVDKKIADIYNIKGK